jgi:hypothetical protein
MVGGWSDEWVIELYWEMIKDGDEVGDYDGGEGDWIGWRN